MLFLCGGSDFRGQTHWIFEIYCFFNLYIYLLCIDQNCFFCVQDWICEAIDNKRIRIMLLNLKLFLSCSIITKFVSLMCRVRFARRFTPIKGFCIMFSIYIFYCYILTKFSSFMWRIEFARLLTPIRFCGMYLHFFLNF